MALQKLWQYDQWWQLRAVKNSTPAVIPPIVTPRVDDTYLSITKYFVTRQALNLYFAGSAFTVDPNVVLSFRDNGRRHGSESANSKRMVTRSSGVQCRPRESEKGH